MTQDSNSKIIFHCSHCHYKSVTTGIDNFTEHVVTSIPILYNRQSRKITTKQRRKQFKCPKCGYIIIPKFTKEMYKQQEPYHGSQDDENNSTGD